MMVQALMPSPPPPPATPGSGRRHAILVGGLSDGMLFTAYCTPLARRLNAAGWACVQPLLSSSLSGWGLASLDQDAAELHLLAAALGREHGAEVGGLSRVLNAASGSSERWSPCLPMHSAARLRPCRS